MYRRSDRGPVLLADPTRGNFAIVSLAVNPASLVRAGRLNFHFTGIQSRSSWHEVVSGWHSHRLWGGLISASLLPVCLGLVEMLHEPHVQGLAPTGRQALCGWRRGFRALPGAMGHYGKNLTLANSVMNNQPCNVNPVLCFAMAAEPLTIYVVREVLQ